MSWLDRLRESFRPRTHPPVRSPTATYPTPVELFEHVIAELNQNWHTDGWAHFEAEAPNDDEPIVVQVAPPDVINTCGEPVRLRELLRDLGLETLAESAARVIDEDPTLHKLPGATTSELAQAVHAVFAIHEQLGDRYEVRGWLEA